MHCGAPQGQEYMSWQRDYLLSSGHGHVVPGGDWNGLDTLETSMLRVLALMLPGGGLGAPGGGGAVSKDGLCSCSRQVVPGT